MDVTRYTTWDQVPGGLYTRTQLKGMDPPRRLKPGVTPRARVLYHGNRYAPLFALEDSEVRPVPSPAQVASARRAGELRYVCRFCGLNDEDGLPLRSRICARCRGVVWAYAMHLEARAMLAGLHERRPFRPLYGACTFQGDGRSRADRLVVVDPERGLEVVADERLPVVRTSEDRLSVPADLERYREGLAEAIAGRPLLTWHGVGSFVGVAWRYSQWLGLKRGKVAPDLSEMPDTTGDLTTDAAALAIMVTGIVSGGLMPPAPAWAAAGVEPARMRPYVTTHGTTRAVLDLVEAVEAGEVRS